VKCSSFPAVKLGNWALFQLPNYPLPKSACPVANYPTGKIMCEKQDMPQMEWVVHPLKENILKSTCLILVLLLLCVAIYLAFQVPFYAFLSAVILFSSLNTFFLPVRYALYTDKVTIYFPFSKRSKPWTDFKSYYIDKKGILLSPFPKPSRLENFRGMYMRCGKNKAEIVDVIKKQMGDDNAL